MLKGLPSGYNKDLQDDKALLFDAIDTLSAGAARRRAKRSPACSFNAGRADAALADETMLATDLADELVRRGVPFREAHGLVGRVLREADAAGCLPSKLPTEVLRAIHVKLVEPTRPILTAEASVEARGARGGTAKSAVLTQMVEARSALAG